jgi:nicotinate dehydrogenase subunit B
MTTAPRVAKNLVDNPVLGRWISLAVPGRVLVRSGKAELGQGIDTALAQIVAQELGLGLDHIDVAPVDTDVSPDEGFTAGSQSVEQSGAALRLVAAQAKALLLAAAAERLGTPAGNLAARDGLFIRDGRETGQSFWDVADAVDWQQPVSGEAVFSDAGGTVEASLPRLDMARKLTSGGFIQDMFLSDMLHARVVRQPFRLARLDGVDEERLARRHPGVEILRQNDFLVLLAADEFTVHRAHADADGFVSWAEEPGRWRPAESAAPRRIETGSDIEADLTSNAVLQARYSRAAIAHASIGPSCALARYEDDRLTVWTHSQGVFPLRGQIAVVLGLAPTSVRVVHVHGSGCYGHNGADDAALDAAIIAMAQPGRAVRVQWSREDELSRAPVGAQMSMAVDAALDANGRIARWSANVLSAPHAQRPGFGGHMNLTSAEALDPGRLPGKVDDLPDIAGGGASRNGIAIYALPRQELTVMLDTASSVRTSSLRSLGAHLNVFAIESAMDELAEMAGVDPLAFRLAHLEDRRCRAVLEGVAEMCGWPGGNDLGEGRGLGLGVARYKAKGAWLAAAAEVSVEEEVRVSCLWLCVDAGLLINPQGARNQIEGGALQALSWTLKEAVPIDDDRVLPFDWSGYPILRFSEVPEVKTRFIVDPSAPPLGAGEAAQGPVAAAIGNAVSRALGLRVRDMPFTRDRIYDLMMSG